MGRTKIDYGIDLGTTNSAIARVDKGEARIFKSDAFQKDTTPSCVSFRMGTVIVGDRAFNLYESEQLTALRNFAQSGGTDHKFNTFLEFKRTMGSDTVWESASAGRSFNSEELSSEVLKALKALVRDEEIASVVITVPARFWNNQIDATQSAAKMAGFQHCELISEPVAASIAFGVSAEKMDGNWLVFDFGGGTFDVALMRVEDGIMKVKDTGGDPHLGGKDVDYAVIDKVIIPYIADNYNIENILNDEYGKRRLREALKPLAEEAKISISPPAKQTAQIFYDKPLGPDDDGEEIEVELEMSLPAFEEAVRPIYQRAIDLTLKLLEKNNLKVADLERVLLVGGPTISQTFRKMLGEQLETKIDTSIDPMTAVAKGAAIFASSKDIPITLQRRDSMKLQLILKYPTHTVETEENLGIKVDRKSTTGSIPEKIFAEIANVDRSWASGRIEIIDGAEIVQLQLNEGRLNSFDVVVFDAAGNRILAEPSNFQIDNRFVPPDATLPYDLCIEAFGDDGPVPRLVGIPGLLKKQTLPAKGKVTFRTQKDIRPGNAEDLIRIPIIQGDQKTRAIYGKHVKTVTISGEELPTFFAKGSEIDISIEVDASQTVYFSAFFPDIDETVKKIIDRVVDSAIDIEELERGLVSSTALLSKLADESEAIDLAEAKKLQSELHELSEILKNGRTDEDAKEKVNNRLLEVQKGLDQMLEDDLFPKAETELNESLVQLRVRNKRFGDEMSTAELENFERLADEAIRGTNLKLVQDLIVQVQTLSFRLFDQGAGVAFELGAFKHFDEDFESISWKNRNLARQLINQANEIALSPNPTKETLRPILQQIWHLLPEPERVRLSERDDEFLTQ